MNYIEQNVLLDQVQSRFTDLPKSVVDCWRGCVAPSLFRKAEQGSFETFELPEALHWSLDLLAEVFITLHPITWMHDENTSPPSFVWRHQDIELIPTQTNPCVSIDRAGLHQYASRYLQSPDLQCEFFDWLFLDSIVYQEYQALLMNPIANLRFSYLTFFFEYGLTFLASFICFATGFRNIGMIFFVLFLISCVLGLIRIPKKNGHKAMVRKALSALDLLYRDLSGNLVSTSKLRESIKNAVNSEVVLDGSVFVIADRLKGDSLRNNWLC